jgi:N-acetylneuraminate lyase
MHYPKLTGLIAAPYVALHPDGSLNLGQIEVQARSLVANGVSAAFVCGTTGECSSLSVSERMAVAARWREVADSSLKILVHVGHCCITDSKALAEHAQHIGASGVGCLAPFFFKPSQITHLVDYCAQVAAACPALPFYYYHIPSMTGVQIPAAEFLRCGGDRIPNLAGVKFTYENLMDFAECHQFAGGRYDALFGRDEMLLAGLALGARGAIGSTYNFAAPVYHRILEAFARGDLDAARAGQARANAMLATFLKWGGLPAGKAMMRLIGIDCGPTRLPLPNLSPEMETALAADLERAGFFQFRSTL